MREVTKMYEMIRNYTEITQIYDKNLQSYANLYEILQKIYNFYEIVRNYIKLREIIRKYTKLYKVTGKLLK